MLGDSDVVGARYSFWGDMEAKVSFTGRSAELKPSGKLHLQLPQTKDHFTWQKVKSSVHNVIVGDLWIEHSGTMEVRNESTGDSCRLQFGQRDWDAYADRGAASAGNEIKGDVVDSNGAAFAAITGHWHERLEMVPVDVRTPSPAKPSANVCCRCRSRWTAAAGSQGAARRTLWQVAPPHPHASMMCNLSRFAMALNSAEPDLLLAVAPTDSRHRPDQRLLEDGEWEAAQREKLRLEEKHRAAQKKRERSRAAHRPRWFRRGGVASSGKGGKGGKRASAASGEEAWQYDGGYWEARQQGDGFPSCASPFA